MERSKKIEYAIALQEKKQILETEKKNIDKQILEVKNNIEMNRSDCQHIALHLGFSEYTLGWNRCLCCGRNLNNSLYTICFNMNQLVDGNKYSYNQNDKSDEEIFDSIQTMFLGFCKMHPEMSDTEIVAAFNELINQKSELQTETEEKPVQKHL